MSRDRGITIRLGVKDSEKVLQALRATGREGQQMASRLERAGRQGDRGLKAVSRGAQDARSQIDRVANRVPVLGRALSALGPAGIAAAAGIGGMVIALGAALRIARSAVKEFDEIGKSADRLGLATDTFQALQQAAVEEGVGWDKANAALSAYTMTAARAEQGQGRLYGALRESNPELLAQITNAETNEERLRVLTDALRESGSETERNRLAYAAFGNSGLAVAQMLERQTGGIDGMIGRARELGVVIDETMIRRSEEMATQMDTAARIMDLNLKQAFVDLAPVLVSAAELFADIAQEVRRMADAFKDIEDQSTATLEERAARLRARLTARPEDYEEQARSGLRSTDRMAAAIRQRQAAADESNRDEVEAELAEIEAILRARREAGGRGGRGSLNGDGNGIIDSNAAAALRERARLEQEAAQIRAQLGDITGMMEIRERSLNALVDEGLITRPQATRALDQYRASLVQVSEADRRAQSIIEQFQTPLTTYRNNMGELSSMLITGRIDMETWTRAAEAARRVYEDSDPVLSRARDVRERLATAEERLAAEQEFVNEAVARSALTAEQGVLWMEEYERALRSTSDATRWLQLEQDLLQGALNGTITSFEDLGRVALRVLYEIARQAITTTDATQSLGSFLADVVGSIAGGWGGGGSAGSKPSAAKAPPVKIPTRHGGGDAVPTPALARRLGLRLEPDEGLHVLRQGEPVLSNSDKAELMALSRAALASRSGGGEGIRVNIHNHGRSEVEVAERRGGDGRRELDVKIREKQAEAIGSGAMDGVFGSRFGAKPSVARR
jgi:hypothetical protein